jgi:hypothetical protein
MSDDVPAAKKGRPKKDPRDLRTEGIRVWVTATEANELYLRARRERKDLSQYCRERLLCPMDEATLTESTARG